MGKDIKLCPCCGAKMVEYTHRLNKPMISAFKNLVHAGGKENLQLIGLTTNQYTNFQKLKYWKIVESCREEGMWEVTPFGYRFFLGDIAIYQRVITYRNAVIRYEGEPVSIRSFLPVDYFKQEDYLALAKNHTGVSWELFD